MEWSTKPLESVAFRREASILDGNEISTWGRDVTTSNLKWESSLYLLIIYKVLCVEKLPCRCVHKSIGTALSLISITSINFPKLSRIDFRVDLS